jgi:hypothetical protein
VFSTQVRRDVLLLLAAKVAVLALIYVFLIAPATKPEPDGSAMRMHLLDQRSRGS